MPPQTVPSTRTRANTVWSGTTEPGQPRDVEGDARNHVLKVVRRAQDGILDEEDQIYWFARAREWSSSARAGEIARTQDRR